MRSSRLLFAAVLPGLLVACAEDAPATEGSAASGEVLDGTISDAMLPVDRVRSEAPLAPRQRTAGSGERSGGPDTDATAAVEGTPAVEGTDVPITVPSFEPAED